MSAFYGTCQCGETIELKRWRAGKRLCVPCATVIGAVHNAQMNRKSGKAWEDAKARWRAIIAEES